MEDLCLNDIEKFYTLNSDYISYIEYLEEELLNVRKENLQLKQITKNYVRRGDFDISLAKVIKTVIINDPATIIFWKDGTKTVVKCNKGDKFDPEKGIALCVMKKVYGNKGKFNDIFKKYIPDEVYECYKEPTVEETLESIVYPKRRRTRKIKK